MNKLNFNPRAYFNKKQYKQDFDLVYDIPFVLITNKKTSQV